MLCTVNWFRIFEIFGTGSMMFILSRKITHFNFSSDLISSTIESLEIGGFLELETFKNKYFENEFSNSYEVLARSTGFFPISIRISI